MFSLSTASFNSFNLGWKLNRQIKVFITFFWAVSIGNFSSIIKTTLTLLIIEFINFLKWSSGSRLCRLHYECISYAQFKVWGKVLQYYFIVTKKALLNTVQIALWMSTLVENIAMPHLYSLEWIDQLSVDDVLRMRSIDPLAFASKITYIMVGRI